VVFALHGWTVAAQQQDGRDIPLYLQPSLGGSRTLRDYHDYQFHDRNLLVLNAESRIAVWTHLDAALFVDAGNVAPRFSDLNLDKTSYGVGARLHNETTTLGRIDLAHGAQGWRFNISTTEPLRLPRTRTRRVAAMIPFAP
jgi:outer membrane translocation and assembly module TamA